MSGKSWTDLGMEQIEGGVHQVKQQAKQAPKNIAKSVISQITGKSTDGDKGSNESAQASAQAQQQFSSDAQSAVDKAGADEANEDVVRELYAPSEKPSDQTDSQKGASEFILKKMDEGMSPEEAQKLYSLRKKLHQEYYEKLTSYERPKEEERTAEKVEKEKEEDDRMNLEEKKKKEAPIAVTMGANKTEQFPGASG